MEAGWDRGDDEDDDHDEARCCRAAKGERVVSWTSVQEREAEEAKKGLEQGRPSASFSFGVILESLVTCDTFPGQGTKLGPRQARRPVNCV
jgi:hypothetical protein